jgi:glycosidase
MNFSQKHNMLENVIKSVLVVGLFLISCVQISAQSAVQCDPPNWYTNTNYRQLDLLVRGIDFSKVLPIQVEGDVKILSFQPMKNSQYAILKIEIPQKCKAQNIGFTFIQKDEEFHSRVNKYELIFPIKERSSFQPSGLETSDLMYMIYPDRFSNGDPNNDSIPGLYQGEKRNGEKTRHGGDLKGIINHLDYVQSLHSTAVWLNPVLENNQPRDSYHGYATTNSYKVDARLGSNEDYLQFSRLCHDINMKVVWDVIYNHWGNEHYLFKNIPDSSWFHFYPTFTKTNYRAETLMDPYSSDIDRDRMSNGWFDTHMPDLNQNNPDLSKYLIQNSIWWVLAGEIDAYRIDTYSYPDQKFMADLNQALRDEFPNFFLFGETWVQSSPVQAYFTEQFKNAPYNSNLNGVTDFQLYFAITKGLNENFGWEEGLRRIQMTLAQDFIYSEPSNNVTFLDNHDLSRFYSVINKDYKKWQAGMGMLLTLRGIPCIYYGTEYLFEGYTNPDDLVRQEFNGGWPGDKKNFFTQENITKQEKEAFAFYQALTKFRQSSNLGSMQLRQFVPEDNVYVYFRYDKKDTYMIVVNLGSESALQLGRYSEMLEGSSKLTNVLTGENHNTKEPLKWNNEASFEIFKVH